MHFMTCPRAPAAGGFQVHFSGKGHDERNPQPSKESADYRPSMKPGFAGGGETCEFRNLRAVGGRRAEFLPSGSGGLCAPTVWCADVWRLL